MFDARVERGQRLGRSQPAGADAIVENDIRSGSGDDAIAQAVEKAFTSHLKSSSNAKRRKFQNK